MSCDDAEYDSRKVSTDLKIKEFILSVFVHHQDPGSPAELELLVLQARFQSEVLGLCETVSSLVSARHDTIAKVRDIKLYVPVNSFHTKVKASADYLDSIWLR